MLGRRATLSPDARGHVSQAEPENAGGHRCLPIAGRARVISRAKGGEHYANKPVSLWSSSTEASQYTDERGRERTVSRLVCMRRCVGTQSADDTVTAAKSPKRTGVRVTRPRPKASEVTSAVVQWRVQSDLPRTVRLIHETTPSCVGAFSDQRYVIPRFRQHELYAKASRRSHDVLACAPYLSGSMARIKALICPSAKRSEPPPGCPKAGRTRRAAVNASAGT